jgi:hypothetical protein
VGGGRYYNWDNEMSNPIPGQYHPRIHGAKTVFALAEWCTALKSRDQDAAALAGNKVLEAARADGAAPEVYNALLVHMQGVVHAVQPAVPTAPGGGLATDAGDGIDWYDPDPDLFYALDKKSGVELADVLEDLLCAADYIARGARAPNRLLFVGPPGTGKTMGARWLGAQLETVVGIMRVDATVRSEVGGTAKAVRAGFEIAWEKKAILVLDEFEAVAVPRSNQGANVGQWSRETTSALLQLLDSLPVEQIVIGATNHAPLVDEAVRRRMRKHVYFGMPDRDTRAAMMTRWWSKAPHDGSAKRVLLDLTEGFSGDVLERIAEDANRAAARRGRSIGVARTMSITEDDVKIAAARTLAAEIAAAS